MTSTTRIHALVDIMKEAMDTTVASMVALEDAAHSLPHVDILVDHLEPGPVVEIGAARQAHLVEQLRQRVGLSQGIDQLRLLTIRQRLSVDAQYFF